MNVIAIVTVDVEPDNVWERTHSKSFKNIIELPRFHRFCREYGIRPTYLVTHSVANNPESCRIIEALLSSGYCEIGAHAHLWETPPHVPMDIYPTAWTGIQYESEVLAQKLNELTTLLVSRFGKMKSYRSGRWGFDGRQLKFLETQGYYADSSITPGVDWSITGAPDYRYSPLLPYHADPDNINRRGLSKIWEIPCTIKPGLRLGGLERTPLARKVLNKIHLGPTWLRCSNNISSNTLCNICKWAVERLPHVNLMTHSSELCPGTSPYWHSFKDIEQQYNLFRAVFSWWLKHNVRPLTLSDFAILLDSENYPVT